HTSAAASTAHGARATKTPQAVATPLPPRNRTQTENTWPTTAAPPYRSAHAHDVPGAWTRGNSHVGSHPLSTSTSITGTAAFHPSTRKVLVAPRLPLPRVLRSTPWKTLPTQRLVGVAPTT